MQMTVASWNIEKNGLSSAPDKQEKVSGFIDLCCDMGTDVVFLCEVHSARISDYESHLRQVYGSQYNVFSLPGGNSNAYVILIRRGAGIVIGYGQLQNLNRGIVLLQTKGFFLGLAHFKSGQMSLTQSQIQNAAGFLQGVGNNSGRWAIAGDVNWDYGKAGLLALPVGTHWASCWSDQTHSKGGMLDWCLAGSATQAHPADVDSMFPPYVNDMSGPDHRPVYFSFQY